MDIWLWWLHKLLSLIASLLAYTYTLTHPILQHVRAQKLSLSSFFQFFPALLIFSFLFCIACFDSDFLVPSVSKPPSLPSLSLYPFLFKALFDFVLTFLFNIPFMQIAIISIFPFIFGFELWVLVFALHLSETGSIRNEGLESEFPSFEFLNIHCSAVKFSLLGYLFFLIFSLFLFAF